MIRVAWDGHCEALSVGFRPEPFLPRSLIASANGDTIWIRRCSGDETILSTRFDQITDGAGAGFETVETCLAYLGALFERRPQADTLDGAYPAARALSALRAVRLVGGVVDYASADDPDHRNSVLGLTTAAADAGAPARVCAAGPLISVGWGLIPGLPLYLGPEGLITQARPLAPLAFALRLGTASDPDTAVIRIGQPILLTGP